MLFRSYGDPRERPRAQVLDDLRNELITREEAELVYGLAPDREER